MKLEREMEYQKKEGPAKVAEYAALKFGQSVETYFPRFVMLEDSLQALTEQLNRHENNLRNNKSEQNMQQQIDILKREFETIRAKVTYLSEPNLELIQLRELLGVLTRDVDFFKGKFKNIATSERMEQIEFQLRSFVHITKFFDLEDSLRNYCTQEEYKRLSAMTNRLTEQFNSYVTAKDLDEKLTAFKARIADTLDDKVHMADFKEQIGVLEDAYNAKFKAVYQTHDQFSRKFMKIIKDVSDVKEEIKFIYQALDHKVEHDETDKIWKTFNRYTTFEDYKELYQKCIPEIQKFEDRLIQFGIEQEKTQIIVRKFDETLCDKASKQNIKEVYDNLKQYASLAIVEDNKKKANELHQQSMQKIEQLEEMIDILGKQISKDIYAAVRKATQQVKQSGESADPATVRVTDELRHLIQKKADKNELVELNSVKSNKVDTEIALRWIDIMHKQLKHMLVLLIEKMRIEIDKKQHQESEHTRANQNLFLFQQALLVSQWINKFDAQNINEYYENSQKVPSDLLSFQMYVEEQLSNIDNVMLSPNNSLLNSSIKMKSRTIGQTKQNQPLKITNNRVNYGAMLNKIMVKTPMHRQASQDRFSSGPGNSSTDRHDKNSTFEIKRRSAIRVSQDRTQRKESRLVMRDDLKRKAGVQTALNSPRAHSSLFKPAIQDLNNFSPQILSRGTTLNKTMDVVDEFTDKSPVNLPEIYKQQQ